MKNLIATMLVVALFMNTGTTLQAQTYDPPAVRDTTTIPTGQLERIAAPTREAFVPPSNDNFAGTEDITGIGGSRIGTNVDATKEAGEPNHAGNPGGKSVWYRWTGFPISVTFTTRSADTDFDTLLAVYTGTSVNALTLVASNDDYGNSLQSRVIFPSVAGATYYIAVDGKGGASGNFTLSWMINRRACSGINYDGGSTDDIAVFRPSTGMWSILLNFGNSTRFRIWGTSGDVPAPADYDGDGVSDFAVFRPSVGVWFIIRSATLTMVAKNWGTNGDVPMPGDYNADGMADLGLFRPSTSTWYVLNGSNNAVLIADRWGQAGDKPAPGDYDGDGKNDLAVFRPSNGTWYIRGSLDASLRAVHWGANGDVPVPGDYTGLADGKSDVAVFRPSNGFWYVLSSRTNSLVAAQWGLMGDIPQPMNTVTNGPIGYTGVTDFVVYRPSDSTWHVLDGLDSTTKSLQWGLPGDIPASAAYIVQP